MRRHFPNDQGVDEFILLIEPIYRLVLIGRCRHHPQPHLTQSVTSGVPGTLRRNKRGFNYYAVFWGPTKYYLLTHKGRTRRRNNSPVSSPQGSLSGRPLVALHPFTGAARWIVSTLRESFSIEFSTNATTTAMDTVRVRIGGWPPAEFLSSYPPCVRLKLPPIRLRIFLFPCPIRSFWPEEFYLSFPAFAKSMFAVLLHSPIVWGQILKRVSGCLF